MINEHVCVRIVFNSQRIIIIIILWELNPIIITDIGDTNVVTGRRKKNTLNLLLCLLLCTVVSQYYTLLQS